MLPGYRPYQACAGRGIELGNLGAVEVLGKVLLLPLNPTPTPNPNHNHDPHSTSDPNPNRNSNPNEQQEVSAEVLARSERLSAQAEEWTGKQVAVVSSPYTVQLCLGWRGCSIAGSRACLPDRPGEGRGAGQVRRTARRCACRSGPDARCRPAEHARPVGGRPDQPSEQARPRSRGAARAASTPGLSPRPCSTPCSAPCSAPGPSTLSSSQPWPGAPSGPDGVVS